MQIRHSKLTLISYLITIKTHTHIHTGEQKKSNHDLCSFLFESKKMFYSLSSGSEFLSNSTWVVVINAFFRDSFEFGGHILQNDLE